jgi:hypothetical protein
MARLTLTVEGPDLIVDVLERALHDALSVDICPDTIFPGFVLSVVRTEVSNA